MTLFELPLWQHLAPYAHVDSGRGNLDLLQLPDSLRVEALGLMVNCVSCGAPSHPLRSRVLSKRSRISGVATERRLFYAATCSTDANPGCSRTRAAKIHKQWMLAYLK